MSQLRSGQTLGPFEILDVLGRGGMATVYRARQPKLNRLVALKVLSPELSDDATFVARFQREAEIAASLEHPHIVPVYDVGEAGGSAYIAMRYVPCRNVADLIRASGPLPLRDALAIVQQVASALDYAHARKVVHRDLKPGNLMIEADNRVSLVDFGIAYQYQQHMFATRLTRTGTVAGTFEYMSPEQVRGERTDFRTDLFALGVVTYELLAGATPFRADSDVAVLHRIVYEPPLPLRRSDVSGSVEQTLATMLAKQPHARFASASAFHDALKSSGQRMARLESGRAHRPVALPVAAAATAVLLAIATVYASRISGPQAAAVPAAISSPPTATVAPTADDLYTASMRNARLLLDSDRPEDALAELGAALARNPRAAEAQTLSVAVASYIRGRDAVARGDWAAGVDALSVTYADQPDMAGGRLRELLFRAHLNRANALAAVQSWLAARDEYRAALALSPGDTQAQHGLAGVERQLIPTPTIAPTRPPATAPSATPTVAIVNDSPFWTVIVASESTRASAEDWAGRLRQRGYAGEVLYSSDYASLNPNYWVAFSGRFRDKAGADALSFRLKEAGFPIAYPREVRR